MAEAHAPGRAPETTAHAEDVVSPLPVRKAVPPAGKPAAGGKGGGRKAGKLKPSRGRSNWGKLRSVIQMDEFQARARAQANWDKVRKVARAIMALSRIKGVFAADRVGSEWLYDFNKAAAVEPHERTREDVDTIMETVKRLGTFRSIVQEGTSLVQIRELCRGMRVQHMRRKEVIFREGDLGDTFYMVVEGSVGIFVRGNREKDQGTGEGGGSGPTRVQHGISAKAKGAGVPRKSEPGGEAGRGGRRNTCASHLADFGKLVVELDEGKSFGEIALMDGHANRTASAVAQRGGCMMVIKKRDYDRVLKEWHSERLAEKMRRLANIPCLSEGTSTRRPVCVQARSPLQFRWCPGRFAHAVQ